MEVTISDLYEFKACPLRYKFTKIDKLTKQITMNDGLREAIYSTIRYFYYNLQEGKIISMQELKEKFGSIWYGDLDLYDIKMHSKSQQRKKELDAIDMLYRFYREQKYKPDEVIAVNLDFRVPFGNDFFVKGQIPVIRNTPRGHEILNFKTGNHKYNEFWQRTDMDLTLQHMAYTSLFKKEVDSICIYNLAKAETIFPKRTKKDYSRLYKTVKMMKKMIEQGWYYPRESYHCDKCPAQNLCMEWR